MNITTFLFLLMSFAVLTSTVTEAVKKFLEEQHIRYASNIVVLIIALILGCGRTILYYTGSGIPFTPLNIIYIPSHGNCQLAGRYGGIR